MAESGYSARLEVAECKVESVCPQGLLGSKQYCQRMAKLMKVRALAFNKLIWVGLIINKKRVLLFLLVIALPILGCSKGTNTGINSQGQAKESQIEQVQDNCRFANTSDCRPIEIRKGGDEVPQPQDSQAVSVPIPINKTNLTNEINNLTSCEEGWKCVQKSYRAFSHSNCTWDSVEYCIYDCKEGLCNPPPICKQNSLECENDNVLRCVDGYVWIKNQSCDYFCVNGACVDKNSTTNSTNQNSSMPNYIADSCMKVPKYNLTGHVPTDEYFMLNNSCSYNINITGWKAGDGFGNIFTFPNFNLTGYNYVSVATGSGTSNQTTLFWGRSGEVWNNNGSTLYLNNSNGASVLVKTLSP